MPRMTVNINQPNVELLEYTAEDINKFIEREAFQDEIQTRIEHALDEAQADALNGGGGTQYVIIKITK
jgi:hypothetical protein